MPQRTSLITRGSFDSELQLLPFLAPNVFYGNYSYLSQRRNPLRHYGSVIDTENPRTRGRHGNDISSGHAAEKFSKCLNSQTNTIHDRDTLCNEPPYCYHVRMGWRNRAITDRAAKTYGFCSLTRSRNVFKALPIYLRGYHTLRPYEGSRYTTTSNIPRRGYAAATEGRRILETIDSSASSWDALKRAKMKEAHRDEEAWDRPVPVPESSRLGEHLKTYAGNNPTRLPGAIPYDYNPSLSSRYMRGLQSSVWVNGAILPKMKIRHGKPRDAWANYDFTVRRRQLWPDAYPSSVLRLSSHGKENELQSEAVPLYWSQAVSTLKARADFRYPAWMSSQPIDHHENVQEWIEHLQKYGTGIQVMRRAYEEWSIGERGERWPHIMLEIMETTPEMISNVLQATCMEPFPNSIFMEDCLHILTEFYLQGLLKFESTERDPAVEEIMSIVIQYSRCIATLSQKTLHLLITRASKEQFFTLHDIIEEMALPLHGHTVLFLAYAHSLYGMPHEAVKLVLESTERGVGKAADTVQSVCCAILSHAIIRDDSYEDIIAYVSEILFHGHPMGLHFFNSIVKAVARKGDLKYAMTLIKRFSIARNGHPLPDAHVAVLRACVSSRDSAMVTEAIETCVKSKWAKGFPEAATQLLYLSYMYHCRLETKDVFNSILPVYRRYYDTSPLIELGFIDGKDEDSEVVRKHERMIPSGVPVSLMVVAWLYSRYPNVLGETKALYDKIRQLVESGHHVIGQLAENDQLHRAFIKAFGETITGLKYSVAVIRDMDRPLPPTAYFQIEKRPFAQVVPNLLTWETLAKQFFKRRQLEAADLILQEIYRRQLRPTIDTFNIYLKYYIMYNDIRRLNYLLKHMEDYKVELNSESMELIAETGDKSSLSRLMTQFDDERTSEYNLQRIRRSRLSDDKSKNVLLPDEISPFEETAPDTEEQQKEEDSHGGSLIAPSELQRIRAAYTDDTPEVPEAPQEVKLPSFRSQRTLYKRLDVYVEKDMPAPLLASAELRSSSTMFDPSIHSSDSTQGNAEEVYGTEILQEAAILTPSSDTKIEQDAKKCEVERGAAAAEAYEAREQDTWEDEVNSEHEIFDQLMALEDNEFRMKEVSRRSYMKRTGISRTPKQDHAKAEFSFSERPQSTSSLSLPRPIRLKKEGGQSSIINTSNEPSCQSFSSSYSPWHGKQSDQAEKGFVPPWKPVNKLDAKIKRQDNQNTKSDSTKSWQPIKISDLTSSTSDDGPSKLDVKPRWQPISELHSDPKKSDCESSRRDFKPPWQPVSKLNTKPNMVEKSTSSNGEIPWQPVSMAGNTTSNSRYSERIVDQAESRTEANGCSKAEADTKPEFGSKSRKSLFRKAAQTSSRPNFTTASQDTGANIDASSQPSASSGEAEYKSKPKSRSKRRGRKRVSTNEEYCNQSIKKIFDLTEPATTTGRPPFSPPPASASASATFNASAGTKNGGRDLDEFGI